MIWLLWKLLTLPIRLALGSIGLVFRTIRVVGLGRLVTFGAGVGAGLALAPESGAQFRQRLQQQYGGQYGTRATPAADLGDTVRHELAHSPRTWHLPQPTVTVDGNRVTLSGEVPHETGRLDLGRAAGAVSGVGAVENHITVTPADS